MPEQAANNFNTERIKYLLAASFFQNKYMQVQQWRGIFRVGRQIRIFAMPRNCSHRLPPAIALEQMVAFEFLPWTCRMAVAQHHLWQMAAHEAMIGQCQKTLP
jgi:AMMECR1 domain-containing protein